MGSRYDNAFAGIVELLGQRVAMTSDGIGTKIEVAERIGRFETLGFDLLAMVVDDLAAIGARPMAVSNILDVDDLDERVVEQLMSGLAEAAIACGVVVSGGEIAQLGSRIGGYGRGMHFNWGATAIGTAPRSTGGSWRDRLRKGDVIISMASDGFRSNGFSMARSILTGVFGEAWHGAHSSTGRSWGDVLLTPSRIFAPGILGISEHELVVHGAVHVTGGGIMGNLARLLDGTGLGAELGELWAPHPEMLELCDLGDVSAADAYEQWNMGNGMLLAVASERSAHVLTSLEDAGYRAREAGTVSGSGRIAIDATAWGHGELLLAIGESA